MTELSQFSKSYSQAVNSIKQIKYCNQRLQDKSSIDYQAEDLAVDRAKEKVFDWVGEVEKEYLDPSTMRRVEIIKQQLQAQLLRYNQLRHEVSKKSPKSKSRSQDQQILPSEDEPQQQLQHSSQYIIQKQKSKQLAEAHKKLLNIHQITKQTNNLTIQQGHKIDIIDQNISTSSTNVTKANKYLEIAAQEQKKGYKKYLCWIWLLLFVIVVVVLVLFFLV